jgi:hypothetical protein
MLGCTVHWTHEELMNLDHVERRRWMRAIDDLNEMREWIATGDQ